VQQAKRCFKQEKVLHEQTQTFRVEPGLYHEEGRERMIVQPQTVYERYTGTVENLLEKARAGEYAVDLIDNVWPSPPWIRPQETGICGGSLSRACWSKTHYRPRLDGHLSGESLAKALRKIQLTDWAEGFDSHFLLPPALRPLRARSLLDLVFGSW